MKKTNKQKDRILMNIYDIILETKFEKEARREMKNDLKNKNISLVPEKNAILIENADATITQYTISIN